MPGDTGPTAQEVDYLNKVLSPGGVGGGDDPWGGGAPPDLSYLYQQQPQQPDYSAYRNQLAQQMASRGGGGGGDPYAAYRAQMASRGGGGYGGGGGAPQAGAWYDPTVGIGENPWKTGPKTGFADPNFIANEMQQRDLDDAYLRTMPDYDKYFGARGPMSFSGDDGGWQYGLQPWQGGSTGVSGSGSGMNTSGWIGGGASMRADPSYWSQMARMWRQTDAKNAWDALRMGNPFSFQQFGGEGAAAAGIAGGFGPGGGLGGGLGGGVGGGGGSVGGGGGGGGGSGSSGIGASHGGHSGGGIGSDAMASAQNASAMGNYGGSPAHFGDTFGQTGTGDNGWGGDAGVY